VTEVLDGPLRAWDVDDPLVAVVHVDRCAIPGDLHDAGLLLIGRVLALKAARQPDL
jgi:hypothetical protein